MTLTVSKDDFKVINRQRCLRQSDIKSVKELFISMENAVDDEELLTIAKQMVKNCKRNEKARHNEYNVNLFKKSLVKHTSTGDMLTLYSACRLLCECDTDDNGSRYYALLAALDDLTKEGYFIRETLSKKTKRGRSHCTVYIVV